MADGAGGSGIGGVLFEAGQAIADPLKKQAQQFGNAAASQITGNQKPLFGPKPATNSFTPKPANQIPGKMPANPFGNFGSMFENGNNGKLPFGAKPPVQQNQSQFSQADLDRMAQENKVKDDEQIAKAEAELQQIQQKLHADYYEPIKNAGENSIAKARKEKEQQEQLEAEQKQQQAASVQDVLPGSPLAKNAGLGAPVAVQQAQTVTEANRGTTG